VIARAISEEKDLQPLILVSFPLSKAQCWALQQGHLKPPPFQPTSLPHGSSALRVEKPAEVLVYLVLLPPLNSAARDCLHP